MIRKYIKAFLNIPMFVAGIIIGVLYIYFVNNPLTKEFFENYSIGLLVPVLWTSRFINDPIIPINSKDDLEYKQLLNTLPLGGVVISKIRFILYIPGFITLILIMLARKVVAFDLLASLSSHLVVSILIDNSDTNPTGPQKTISYVTSLVYLILVGILLGFCKFSTMENVLYIFLLYVPLIIYVFYFMKYKEKRRWRND